MAETADSLAAVRRLLDDAALEAPDSAAIYEVLAGELLACVDHGPVHAMRLAQDGFLARGAVHVPGGGDPQRYVLPLTGPSGVRRVAGTKEPLSVDDASTGASSSPRS